MIYKTWSCLVLYQRSSSAVLQLFRMWHKVCRSPHNLQAADIWSFFLHRARLALCGRVSVAEFKANFICAEESDWIALDHAAEALVSTRWNSLPCVSRERLCSRCFLFGLLVTACLAFLDTVFPGAPRSEAKASCAIVYGWNLTRCWFDSFLKLSFTTWFTPPSCDVISRLALPTWSFWYRSDGKERLSPPTFCGRKSLAGSGGLARPAHLLRYRVASESKVFSIHNTGNSEMVRSHEIRGQIPRRYNLSFCFLVTKVSSTQANRVASLFEIASRARAGSLSLSLSLSFSCIPGSVYTITWAGLVLWICALFKLLYEWRPFIELGMNSVSLQDSFSCFWLPVCRVLPFVSAS